MKEIATEKEFVTVLKLTLEHGLTQIQAKLLVGSKVTNIGK